MSELGEEHRDILGEFVNLGIGRAASALSDMTGDEVLLTIPSIELCSREQVSERVGIQEGARLMSVTQGFSGDLSGDAMLFFPEDSSVELVRTVLGKTQGLENMTELEEDAFVEVGNVLLNACLSAFADSLEVALETALPQASDESLEGLLDALGVVGPIEKPVLVMSIHFSLSRREIRGHLLMVFDAQGVHSLLEQVDAYRARMGLA